MFKLHQNLKLNNTKVDNITLTSTITNTIPDKQQMKITIYQIF